MKPDTSFAHRSARVVTWSLCLFLLLLAACSREQPTPTAAPTNTPTRPATNTSVPAATATPQPSATATRSPSATATITVPPTPSSSPTVTPTLRDPLLNPLTGLRVNDPALLQKRPIVVRYGNDQAGWPLSGIALAEIVYEDLMEGNWITRFTAVFLVEEPVAIGPIRSARPISIELMGPYDGVYVFSGASAGTARLFWPVTFPLIHEGTEGNGFYRVSRKPAPYNLYGSIPAVRQYMVRNQLVKTVTTPGFVFSPEGAPPPSGQPALRIRIPYPPTSVVEYRYDQASGRYLRWVAGQPFTDELTREQIAATNVIIQVVEHQKTDIVEDSLGSTALNIVTTGEGRAVIIRDGVAIEGRWRRPRIEDQTEFVDAQGQPIPLKPGNSWIQFVPPTYEVTIGG